MRDFSKVAPNVWKSQKFWRLPDDAARFCYLYLLTGPHANSVGCYDLDPAYACADLRWTEKQYRNSIDTLSIGYLAEFDGAENTVRITNWMKFNTPMNPKHALGMLAQLDQASSKPLKLKQLNDFSDAVEFLNSIPLRNSIDTLSKQYRKGITTETETETETEKERETETKSKTETYQNYVLPTGLARAPNGAARPSEPDNDLNLPEHLNTPYMRRAALKT